MKIFPEAVCMNNDSTKGYTLSQTTLQKERTMIEPDNLASLHSAVHQDHSNAVNILPLSMNDNQLMPYTTQRQSECFSNEVLTVGSLTYSDTTCNNNEESIEWFDTYQHAYRIAYECHEIMKKWLTKVPFAQLLQEIDSGYVAHIDFEKTCHKTLIQDFIKQAITNNDSTPLLRAYTEKTRFFSRLNEDLATTGSEFRFHCLFSMSEPFNNDNCAPQDCGPHIFATIASHHEKLKQYRHYTGITYRGVIMTRANLDEYHEGKYILTRSFLSSSTDLAIAQNYLCQDKSYDSNVTFSVLCIYHIRNPRVALDLHSISAYPDENEILVVPFVTFKIISIRTIDEITYIEHEECSVNL